MPRTAEHKQQSRGKILASAHRLFTRNGFENTSINDVMQHAKLTRGAFYAHFDSKEDLYQQSILAAAPQSGFAREKPVNMNNKQWIKALMESYLSLEHVNMEFSPCALSFLVTDVAIREPGVRTTYTKVFRRLNSQLASFMDPSTADTRDKVLAATAMMIGGVAVSRAVNNNKTRKELLQACRQAVSELLELT